MKLSKVIISALAIGAALSVVSVNATAADVVVHGSLCNPINADQTKFDYSQYGITNISTTAAGTAVCGATLQWPTVTKIEAWVYDRNAASNVTCTAILTGLDGITVWTSTQSTAGTSTPAVFLSFPISPGKFTATGEVQCSVPPAVGGNSAVASIRVIG